MECLCLQAFHKKYGDALFRDHQTLHRLAHVCVIVMRTLHPVLNKA